MVTQILFVAYVIVNDFFANSALFWGCGKKLLFGMTQHVLIMFLIQQE
jgi:hypothetical protein